MDKNFQLSENTNVSDMLQYNTVVICQSF